MCNVCSVPQEKEVACGAAPPRILSLDPYFVSEVERVERDPETGRRVKRKVEEYEYDEAAEPSYRTSLFKLFNKTLEDGFFQMIIVDSINHKVHTYITCMYMYRA